MGKMISFKVGDERFNFRVAAVFIKDHKVLLHQYENDDFYAFPGGRAEMLENSEQTIIREMKEELNITINIDKLLWLVEDFFCLNDIKFHEICLYYLVDTQDDLPIEPFTRKEIDGTKLFFKWFDIDQLDDLYMVPEKLKVKLKHLPTETEHLLINEL